ncbi:hypothetical protein VE03_07069 [Pseudogymnoascus sp. 23342-1-I1]|nr:hypothetical protein VE03_07069 [Pseudogymnoascus sp. 23342-1-I1]
MSHMILPSRISKLFSWLVHPAKTQDNKPEASTLSAKGRSPRTDLLRDWRSSLVLSPLEKLPLELQILILASAPDSATLRGLIYASLVYHRAYMSSKVEILSALIEKQQIPGTEVDALAVLLSLDYADGMQDHPDEVIAFLDRYRHARGRGRWLNTKNPPLPSRWRPLQTHAHDLMTMVRFHNLAERLTDRFLEYMERTNKRYNFAKVDGLITISTQERMRIYRAIYRLQVYYNLFGMAELTSRMQTDNLFVGPEGVNGSKKEIWDLFFRTFTGWERAEMYTIEHFVISSTVELIEALVPEPEKDIRCILAPDHFYYITFESIACAGPLFLAKIIRQETLEQQYSVVADNFDDLLRSDSKKLGHGPMASSIMNVCGAEGYLPHHILYPVDKIIASIATMDDDGDFDMCQMPWYEKPSAGYVYYFRQSQFWLHGDVPHTHEEDARPIMVFRMRRVLQGGPWSYVFWDRARLVQVGAVNA